MSISLLCSAFFPLIGLPGSFESAEDGMLDVGEGSSNPFNILLGAQKEAADRKQAGKGTKKKVVPASALTATEHVTNGKPVQAGVKREIGQEWQRQSFPNPSGYAPGNLVAQAKAVSPQPNLTHKNY